MERCKFAFVSALQRSDSRCASFLPFSSQSDRFELSSFEWTGYTPYMWKHSGMSSRLDTMCGTEVDAESWPYIQYSIYPTNNPISFFPPVAGGSSTPVLSCAQSTS